MLPFARSNRLLAGLALAMFCQCSTAAEPLQASTHPENAMLKPGGLLAATLNRSALRAYAEKMADGRITAAELTDYLIKGGSFQRAQRYDRTKDFFVGSAQQSVLRFFIAGPQVESSTLPTERLKCLKLLLDVGSDPNLPGPEDEVGGEDLLSPTLFAAAGNDLPALKLLIAAGGHTELQEKKYAGVYGPALALATRPDVLAFLAQSGADPKFTDGDGNNLLHLSVERIGVAGVVEKFRWLLAQGVSPRSANRWGDSAETRLRDLVGQFDQRLERDRAQLDASLQALDGMSWPEQALSAAAVQARKQAEAEQIRAQFQADQVDLLAAQRQRREVLTLLVGRTVQPPSAR